ncbi:hypothetical protein IWQ61_009442 [Dispira simplex]|nr:hypothetical protein IWQ61_009442 [Dispira simplex]
MDLVHRYRGDDSYESDTEDEVENKSERSTDSFASVICNAFLCYFTRLQRREPPSWEYQDKKMEIQYRLDGTTCTVHPDGSNVYAPGKPKYNSTLLQKAAETIAMAKYQPREVFGIEFSHRFVAFWRALIPENYLELVKGSGNLPPDMILEMRRSAVLDFVSQNGRYKFARACLALLMYLDEQVVWNE